MQEIVDYAAKINTLMFFPAMTDLHPFLWDDECGIVGYLDHVTLRPDNLEAFHEAVKRCNIETLEYHHRICGTMSHSGELLTCGGKCPTELPELSDKAFTALLEMNEINDAKSDIKLTDESLRWALNY